MSSNTNIETVKTIGKGIRKTEEAVAAVVATLPEGFDPAARGAVAEAVKTWACPDGNVPKQKTGPAGNQTATDFGRGFDTLVAAVKRALKEDGPKPVVLRATLSGEGGGSVTIPTDSPLYAQIVAMIKGDGESDDSE